jgi:hypothetical protein
VAVFKNSVTKIVANMLFTSKAADPVKPVANYNVKSLIAAKLCNWFANSLKTYINVFSHRARHLLTLRLLLN